MAEQRQTASGSQEVYPPIDDYAVIGDTRTSALVSREGSVDWLCLPRFDSPSIFGALLDRARGGRFRIGPAGAASVTRRYLPDTNVLRTTYRTDGGELTVREAMTLPLTTDVPSPDHELLREVECVSGSVDVEVEFEPRPQFGLAKVRLEDRGRFGFRWAGDQLTVSLLTDEPLELSRDGSSASALWRLSAGHRRYASLAADLEAPAVMPALGRAAHQRLDATEQWWRGWTQTSTYSGRYRDAVMRSALALKLLSYSPSGAIIAAPTTSLPEEIGGQRNYDYRFCWLRDAAFLMRALHSIGFRPLADAFLAWMLHATRLTHPELQVVYDVYGRTNLAERTLDHLAGYRGSRPVRVGNAACEQLQLDVYGEVIDAAERFVESGGELDGDQVTMLEGFAETVCRRWREPDNGIWESRGERQHYVHSKVLCWVALDRIVRMHERGHLRTKADRFRMVREQIRGAVDRHGYDSRAGTYVRAFGSRDVDASLLALPLLDYLPADDPRMKRTFERVTAELATGSLYRRYASATADGLSGGEGSFGICSFWAVECRALAGDVAGARAALEELLGYANDVGLYGEEIETASGAALGNFPQGLTHIGLINAALTLAKAEEKQ